jgi:type VI secretion system secreted protein VgrG
LTDYPRQDQNREYLVIATNHQLASDSYTSGGSGADEDIYACDFTAIDAKRPYRAPRLTPKPVVPGPQTAIVVGKSGEEIWTDKYGRVKVQFHWDRDGKMDENSSCWVRVSQLWAGKSWGAMAIPRIGHEVIVEFLEGDPDQPIITGRVYNGDNMPPYGLPGDATRTTIKSNSSKGGGGFNELRFEDKSGSEEVYVQAEKDMNTEIKNDETRHVGHDRSKTIDNDETVTVGHDRTETVGNDETITIGKNRTETVAVNEMIAVGVSRERAVGAHETIGIGGNRTKSIGNDESVSIGSNHTVSIGSNQTVDIGENDDLDVGQDRSVTVGKELTVDAGDQILIKTGAASILMKKNGDITIKGKLITIKGSGNIVIKGTKILEN